MAGGSNTTTTITPIFQFLKVNPQTLNPFHVQGGSNNPAPAGGDPNNDNNDNEDGNPPLGNRDRGPPSRGSLGGGSPGSNASLTSNNQDNLAEAISFLTVAVKPCNHTKTKACELDQFDSSDLEKVTTFIFQCELYFQGSDSKYDNEVKWINFALSYLKSSTL